MCAFIFILQYVSIHWSAKQSIWPSCFLFILPSPCPPFLRRQWPTFPENRSVEQWQLYWRLSCDELGTGVVNVHLHCSWLVHFVQSLLLQCNNSLLFFYQGIHICMYVCVCVLYLLVKYLHLKWFGLQGPTTVFTSKTGYIPYFSVQSYLFSLNISKTNDRTRKQGTGKHWKNGTCYVCAEV